MGVRLHSHENKGWKSRVPAVLLGVVLVVVLCLSLLVGTMLWIAVTGKPRWFGRVHVIGFVRAHTRWKQGMEPHPYVELADGTPRVMWVVRLGDCHWWVSVDR